MQTFWDPGNLLQITSADDHGSYDIKCIGFARSKNNARCRWTVHDSSSIYSLLEGMAQKKPANITRDQLRELAQLCLCTGYHFGQVQEVVQRWTAVVERAAKEQERLIANTNELLNPRGRETTLQSEDKIAHNLEIFKAQEKLEKSEGVNAELRTRVVDAEDTLKWYHTREAQLLGQIDEQRIEMQRELASMKLKVGIAQEEKEREALQKKTLSDTLEKLLMEQAADQNETRQNFEMETRRLQADLSVANNATSESIARSKLLESLLDSLQAEILHVRSDNESLNSRQTSMEADLRQSKILLASCQEEQAQYIATTKSLESQNSSLQAQLVLVNGDLERSQGECARVLQEKDSLLLENTNIQDQQNSMMETLKNLQLESEDAKIEGYHLAASLSKSNQLLQSSQQELLIIQERNIKLSDQGLVLQQQLSILEKSIQSCWWHRIRAWIWSPDVESRSPLPDEGEMGWLREEGTQLK